MAAFAIEMKPDFPEFKPLIESDPASATGQLVARLQLDKSIIMIVG
jgi:hypothetical protein